MARACREGATVTRTDCAPSEKIEIDHGGNENVYILRVILWRPHSMAHPDSFIRGPRAGFPVGYSAVTRAQQTTTVQSAEAEVDFGVCMMTAGEVLAETHASETAWVLLHGEAELEFGGRREIVRRASLFDEAPTALHLGPGTAVTVPDAGPAGVSN